MLSTCSLYNLYMYFLENIHHSHRGYFLVGSGYSSVYQLLALLFYSYVNDAL